MQRLITSLTLLFAACLCVASPASAKKDTLYSDIVSPDYEGDLPVQIIGLDSKIRASIDAVDGSEGGLVGALVGGLLNKGSRSRAEERAVPVVTAMQGIPLETIAKNSAEASLRAYFKVPAEVDIPFSSDNSEEAKLAFVRQSQSDHVTFVDYDYSISPKFDAVTLTTNIYVVSSDLDAFSKPEKALLQKNLVFVSGIVSVIELPNPSKEKEANIAVWAANDAELVGRALELAFTKSEELTSRILNMDATSAAELESKEREKIKINLPLITYRGRRQDHEGEGDLIWTRYINKVYGYAFKTRL